MVSLKNVEQFLREVDTEFPIALSSKVKLSDLAEKYCKKATLCCKFEDDRIIAMVAGYLDDTPSQIGYISLVGTTPDARRKGYSSHLLMEFIEQAKEKNLYAVHVYTHKSNYRAVKMYQKAGFTEYHPIIEEYPEDFHFIYYLSV